MRICGVISSLRAGGAERAMATLADAWGGRGHAVTVVTLAGVTEDFFLVDPCIVRIGLGLMLPSRSWGERMARNCRRVRALRKAIGLARPDVVVSFGDTTNVLAVAATRGLRVPVLVSERTHPPNHQIGRGWALLRRLTYRRADAVVVETERTGLWARDVAGSTEIEVIPNAISLDFAADARVSSAPRRATIVAMGRLSREKGFDLLLHAFASVAPRHADWCLVILGQGPEEGELGRLADRLLPARSVRFLGLVTDPSQHLREACIFVLPSRYEGFPNALLEAMACGCAVIAADCPAGPREIIRQDIDGVLVPPEDSGALAEALERLIRDPAVRLRLGSRALEVTERFSLDIIGQRWEDVMRRAILRRFRR